MNEPRLIFRKLNKGNKGEEDIPHTKTNSTMGQSIISKNGASAVEEQKISLAENQRDRSNKNELGIKVFPVEQKIGKANPLHQKEAEEEIEEVKENVKCFCKKHCKSKDLDMNEPRLIFRNLTKGEEDIPHTKYRPKKGNINQQDQGSKAPSTSPFHQLKMEPSMDSKYFFSIPRVLELLRVLEKKLKKLKKIKK